MKLLSSLILAAGVLAALPASAQFQKPEDAIKYRKSAFTVMGTHFGRIGAMAQGRVPFDAAAATANADIVVAVSKLPFAAFVDGSQSGDTKAKAEVWSKRDAFNAAAVKMQEEVAKLDAAAKTGNLDTLKAAFGAAAGTCKNCHDNYRQ